MKKFWSKRICSITPYTYGEQPQDKIYIKLNTNENPYPPSQLVIDSIKNYNYENLKLYPDPLCHELVKQIASFFKIDSENVFTGNGSDEILSFIFMAFFDKGDNVIMPEITYSFYEVYSNFFEVNRIIAKQDENMNICIDDFYKEAKAIILANPNAPTGTYIELNIIEKIISENQNKLIVIDEAYIDFGGESAVNLIQKYENLLIVQTVSKSRSLAGMRIGFAMGNKNLIKALDTVKNSINSYTLDSLAIIAGKAAFEDEQYFEMTRKKIIVTREKAVKKLKKIGFNVLDSKANFVFVSHPSYNAEDLYFRLKQNGVLVRHFNKNIIKNYLRITIGTDFDMNIFFKRLQDIMK